MPAAIEAPPAPDNIPSNAAAAAAQPAIQVPQMPAPSGPATPPKPGSARERMHKELLTKAGVTPAVAPAPASAPAAVVAPAAAEPAANAPAQPASAPAADPNAAPTADPAKVKANPWKLFESEKAEKVKLAQRVQELEKQLVPEQERKAYEQRTQQAEARAKALEDEIRFTNYQKSGEFQEKYQQPYEAAWKRAMSEISEIAITDPQTHETRAVTAGDLLTLVNLPLGQAQELAEQAFGNLASYVMGHRKEIRSLFDAQQQAIDKAKTDGATREQQRAQAWKGGMESISRQVKDLWEQTNTAVLADEKYGHFFKPVEGNQDWNQRLAKGFELVDKAYSQNPADPRLKPEERAAAVKRHAAVRNRAAAFGPLRWKLEQAEKQLADAKAELAKYQASTPPAGGSAAPPTNGTPARARDQVMAGLQKLARPA